MHELKQKFLETLPLDLRSDVEEMLDDMKESQLKRCIEIMQSLETPLCVQFLIFLTTGEINNPVLTDMINTNKGELLDAADIIVNAHHVLQMRNDLNDLYVLAEKEAERRQKGPDNPELN